MEEKTNITPLEDLRKNMLNHYDEAATKVNHWSSPIPKAINFYFDYNQMSFWQKIKEAFKK